MEQSRHALGARPSPSAAAAFTLGVLAFYMFLLTDCTVIFAFWVGWTSWGQAAIRRCLEISVDLFACYAVKKSASPVKEMRCNCPRLCMGGRGGLSVAAVPSLFYKL